jgi:hypothetical protein
LFLRLVVFLGDRRFEKEGADGELDRRGGRSVVDRGLRGGAGRLGRSEKIETVYAIGGLARGGFVVLAFGVSDAFESRSSRVSVLSASWRITGPYLRKATKAWL